MPHPEAAGVQVDAAWAIEAAQSVIEKSDNYVYLATPESIISLASAMLLSLTLRKQGRP